MRNWVALSSEKANVIYDENGVPIEWTLLKIGNNPLYREGLDIFFNLKNFYFYEKMLSSKNHKITIKKHEIFSLKIKILT